MATIPVYLVLGNHSQEGTEYNQTPNGGRVSAPVLFNTRFNAAKSLRDGYLGRTDNPGAYFTNPIAGASLGAAAGGLKYAYERVRGVAPGRIKPEPVTPGTRQNLFIWNHIGPTHKVTSITLGATITFTTENAHSKSGVFECFPMGFGQDQAFGFHDYGIAGLDGELLTATSTGTNTFTVPDPGATGSSVLGTVTAIVGAAPTVNITAAVLTSNVLTLPTAAHGQTGAGFCRIDDLRGISAESEPFVLVGEVIPCTYATATTITVGVTVGDQSGALGYVGTGTGSTMGAWDVFNPEMNSDTTIVSGDPTAGTQFRTGRYCPDFPIKGWGYDATLLRRISDMEFSRGTYAASPVYVFKTQVASPLRAKGVAPSNATKPRFLKRYTGELWDNLIDPMLAKGLGDLITAGHTPIIRGIVATMGGFDMTTLDISIGDFTPLTVSSIVGDVVTFSSPHGLASSDNIACRLKGVTGTTPSADDVWDVLALPSTTSVQLSQTFTGTSAGGVAHLASAPCFFAEDLVEFVTDLRDRMVALAADGQTADSVPAILGQLYLNTSLVPQLNQDTFRAEVTRAAALLTNTALADQKESEFAVSHLGSSSPSTLTADSYQRMGETLFESLNRRLDGVVSPVNRGMPVYIQIADSYGEGLPTFAWASAFDGDYNGTEVAGRQSKIYNWGTKEFEDYNTLANAGTFPAAKATAVAGFEASMVLELTKRHDGSDIFLVKLAVSGSRLGTRNASLDIGAWNKADGDLWSWIPEAFDQLAAWGCSNGLVPDVRGAFVFLGTNDAVNPTLADDFVTKLPTFKADLREALSTRTDANDMPIVWGEPLKHPDNLAFHTELDTIKTALRAEASADAQFVAVNLDSANYGSRTLTEVPINPDNIHISLAGQIRMGILMNQGLSQAGQIYGNVMVEPNPVTLTDTV